MRPLFFHVADSTIGEGLKAFFRRENWHHALRCARFDLDPDSPEDIYQVPGEFDSAVWTSADEHLAPFRATHERAVVILDEHFDPWPSAAHIRDDICRDLTRAGWDRARFEVIVIQPMLEAWLWMDSDHVARAFGVEDYATLRGQLEKADVWTPGDPKPHDLKGARNRAARLGGTKSGSVAFRHVFGAVSRRALDRCQEPGFMLLRRTLQTWFPPEGGPA